MIGGGIPTNVSGLLDTFALTQLGASFESSVRPWLGEGAAIGFLPPVNGEFEDIVIALAVSDRDAAGLFVQNNMSVQPAGSQGDFALYSDPADGMLVAINDSVLLATTELSVIGPERQRLAGLSGFQSTMASLAGRRLRSDAVS